MTLGDIALRFSANSPSMEPILCFVDGQPRAMFGSPLLHKLFHSNSGFAIPGRQPLARNNCLLLNETPDPIGTWNEIGFEGEGLRSFVISVGPHVKLHWFAL